MLDDGSSSSLVYGVEGNWLVLLPMLNVNGDDKFYFIQQMCFFLGWGYKICLGGGEVA